MRGCTKPRLVHLEIMPQADTSKDLNAAVLDIEDRTLSTIEGNLARLIYLASTRDYNTGRYYHEGLSTRYTGEATEEALALCHRKVFDRLALVSVRELFSEVARYIRSSRVETSELLGTWQALEPYRVAIPFGCDPLAKEVFFSNVKIVLAILQSQKTALPDE